MPTYTKHARFLPVPEHASLVNARLDSFREEQRGTRRDLIIDYHALRMTAPAHLVERDGEIVESVEGMYEPRRLRFHNVAWFECTGLFADLDALPPEHAARQLLGMLHWNQPNAARHYLLLHNADEPATLMLAAQRCTAEARAGTAEPVALLRSWSPSPTFPARLVPAPARLHQRYNGDPIRVRIGRRTFNERLFIGDIHKQTDTRPAVDAVLNLCELHNPWSSLEQPAEADRWACQGEGQIGMSLATIRSEAAWVVAHLQAGRRVLVHCYAGINRSSTICCATLMLLERISAEAALARVREQHPWARPDSYHWLKLRWLEQQLQGEFTANTLQEHQQ